LLEVGYQQAGCPNQTGHRDQQPCAWIRQLLKGCAMPNRLCPDGTCGSLKHACCVVHGAGPVMPAARWLNSLTDCQML
jgi:hypothetical protein